MLAGYDHLLRAAERLRWDDRALDLGGEGRTFAALDGPARGQLRRLLAGFCVGEQAVAEHLIPFEAAADDEALKACLRAQADDERRHARFFARVAREVAGMDPVTDAPRIAGPAVRRLFAELLPAAAREVATDPAALPHGVGLYHLVLEAIAFATGQDLLVRRLEEAGTLPATLEGARRVQADERWHVGLGMQILVAHGAPPPDGQLEEAMTLALDCWGAPADRAAALDRHRRRLRLLTARASAR